MSAKNLTDLQNQLLALIPDNTTQEISADDERTVIGDGYESFLNIIDGGNVVVAVSGYTTEVSLTDRKNFAYKGYVDDSISAISIASYFIQGGNSFTDDAELGTNDAFALLFKTQATVRGGITSSGQWMIGTTTPQASTELTIKGTGTGSGTNTFVGLNSADALIFKLRDDGGFVFYENLYDSSSVKIADVANRIFYTTGNVGAIAINEFALYPNNSFSSLEWDLRICKDSSNDETLDWENREFTKAWTMATGDLKFTLDTKGIVLKDRTSGSYFRIYLDAGSLQIEAE